MSFATDRALQALQGQTTTPALQDRTDLTARTSDSVSTPVYSVPVYSPITVKDPLAEMGTRQRALEVVLPKEGAAAVISVLFPDVSGGTSSLTEVSSGVTREIVPPGGTPREMIYGIERGTGRSGEGPGPFGGSLYNVEFILTSVTERQQEKTCIYQTFDGFILYTMGTAPSVYRFAGYLVNRAEGSGAVRFEAYYEANLKASAAVANGSPATVSYLQTVRHGFALNMAIGHQAHSPGASEFSFDFLVVG